MLAELTAQYVLLRELVRESSTLTPLDSVVEADWKVRLASSASISIPHIGRVVPSIWTGSPPLTSCAKESESEWAGSVDTTSTL